MNMTFKKLTSRQHIFASFALLALTGGIASQVFTGEASAQIPSAQGTVGTPVQNTGVPIPPVQGQQVAYPTAQINWQNDINTALAIAKTQQKMVLVHFYGNNCPPCKAMDAEVYADPRIIVNMIQMFIPVKIDTGMHPELVKQFGIKAIPTNLVLDENGKIIDKRQGGISADRFCQYLDYLKTQQVRSVNPPIQNPPVQAQVAGGIAPPVQNPAQNVVAAPAAAAPIIAAPIIATAPITAVPTVPTAPAPAVPNTAAPPMTAASPAAPMAAPAALNDPFLQQTALQPITSQPTASQPITAQPTVSPPVTAQPTTQQPIAPPAEVAKSQNPMRNAEPTQIGGVMLPVQNVAQNVITAPVAVAVPENCETIKPAMVELPLALDGYCPVVLTNEERWTQGNPQFYAMFQGLVYHFSCEKSMQTFVENPLKYAPAVKGEDIVLFAERNKKNFGSRKFGAWFEGRIYLFSCQETLNVFAAKPEHYAAVAKQQEMAMNTSLNMVQR